MKIQLSELFWLPWLIVLLVQLAVYVPSLPRWVATDESIWVGNGIKFAQALLSHTWANTRLTTRPGVSVIWVTALSSYMTLGHHTLVTTGPDTLSIRPDVIWAGRTALLVVLCILNGVLYVCATTFFARVPAALAVLLIGIHPIFTQSRYLAWTDMVLVYVMAITLLAFMAYLHTHKRGWIVVAGLFFGVAILTKIVAWSVIGMAMIAILLYQSESLRLKSKGLAALAVVILIGVGLFYLLYPAAWSHPGLLVDRTREVKLHYVFSSDLAAPEPSVPWHYPLLLFMVDPVLMSVSIVCVYLLVRLRLPSRFSLVLFISVGLYALILWITSFFKDVGLFAITSDRYVAPLIPFCILGCIAVLLAAERRYHQGAE